MPSCLIFRILNHLLSYRFEILKSFQARHFFFYVRLKVPQPLLGLSQVLLLVDRLALILQLLQEIRLV